MTVMPLRCLALASFAVVLLSLTAVAQNAALYDVVIRNGYVLDGAGNPSIRADVAIKDGRFVRIGIVTGRGEKEIDAAGKYVSPGWIDMMDQSGGALLKNGLAENKLREGVTTAIGGEGGTPVPVDRIPEYFATLERQGISINFGTYFSATQARVAVLAQDSRAPTAEELTRMQGIMEQAMRAGAIGMTTALIYPPSSFATTAELIEMAKAAAKYGGIYASHIRGEGKEVVESVAEAIEIGEKAGLPTEVFHLKVAYSPGWGTLMKKVGELVEAARRRGVDVAADLYARAYGNFPRVIARYVREKNVLTLSEAIRKMTSWPATRMRLADRGVIREGLWADVVIFDYDTIQDRSTYEQPHVYPDGIEWVLVNGQVVIDHGTHTGVRAGKVLYGPGRSIAQPQAVAARSVPDRLQVRRRR